MLQHCQLPARDLNQEVLRHHLRPMSSPNNGHEASAYASSSGNNSLRYRLLMLLGMVVSLFVIRNMLVKDYTSQTRVIQTNPADIYVLGKSLMVYVLLGVSHSSWTCRRH